MDNDENPPEGPAGGAIPTAPTPRPAPIPAAASPTSAHAGVSTPAPTIIAPTIIVPKHETESSIQNPANQHENRRVAVIAVHGVGKHEPGSSAHAMAELLYSPLRRQPMTVSRPFMQETIHVPLRPVHSQPPAPGGKGLVAAVAGAATKVISKQPIADLGQALGKAANAISDSLAEGSTALGARLAERGQQRLDETFEAMGVKGFRARSMAGPQAWEAVQKITKEETATGRDAATEFMRLQLSQYEGGADGRDYTTVRLQGQMTGEGGVVTDVDVYEVFWADLARPMNSVLSFLQAVYQLILHLAELSRLPLDMAAEEKVGWVWQTLRWAQRWAVRMLTVPIPILNILLLVALLGATPRWLMTETTARATVIGIAAVIGIVGTWLVSGSWRVARNPVTWALGPAAAMVSGAVAWGLMAGIRAGFYRHEAEGGGLHAARFVGAMEGWLAGLVVLYFLVCAYRDVRQGAGFWSYIFFGLFFVIFVWCLCSGWRPSVEQATVWTEQGLLAGLRKCWLAVMALGWMAGLVGVIGWRQDRKSSPEVAARSHAAVRTGRLALALPTLLFFLLSVSLWSGGFTWIAKRTVGGVGLFDGTEPAAATQLKVPGWLALSPGAGKRVLIESREEHAKERAQNEIPGAATAVKRDITTMAYFHQVLLWEAGTGLSVMVVIALMAAFLLGWWASRSAVKEIWPLNPRTASNAQGRRMGAWTTRGLDAMGIVTLLFWVAIFGVPVFFALAENYGWFSGGDGLTMSATQIVLAALAGTVTVLGLLLHRISPGLGAVLDVDNYLRAGPRKETPKAKIMERYVSILRYVASEGATEKRDYKSVVIVAHSLGAMISADLLRFLKIEGDEDLAALGYGRNGKGRTIPIQLFTMGNPLRQLMNRFFPHLYRWVGEVPDDSLAAAGDVLPAPPIAIAETETPGVEDLGVERWVNAYRSGDYVGRSLWSGEWYARNTGSNADGQWPEKASVIADAARRELCIGAGAHTHYWDETAPDITMKLEELIQA